MAERVQLIAQRIIELQEMGYRNPHFLVIEADIIEELLLHPNDFVERHVRILHTINDNQNVDFPVQQNNLSDLARDSQNVHTGPVNNQTNSNTEILLSTPVPSHQQTVEEITSALMKRRKKPTKYMEDMVDWYNKHSLYKQLLDGLWARIKSSPNKKELEKRLTEELREMAGKCTQGHISRLCNVLVGFDEDFKPEISVGEHLQNKMSAIAQKDITLEEKVLEALILMEELGIPAEEQDAWIDAL